MDDKFSEEDLKWVKEERKKQEIWSKRFKAIGRAGLQWIGGLIVGIITTILAYLLDRY